MEDGMNDGQGDQQAEQEEPTEEPGTAQPPQEGSGQKRAGGADGTRTRTKKKHSRLFRICRAVIIVLVCLLAAMVVTVAISKVFTGAERTVRSDWSVQTGELLGSHDELGLEIHEASTGSDLRVIQVVPEEIDQKDFTYYDTDVQGRIAQFIAEAKDSGDWEASSPLAILNPFGTGTNGLYLYFTTDLNTKVTYTIEAPDTSTFTATAQNTFLDDELQQKKGDKTFTRRHEFQIVGLVPGKTNQVTLNVEGRMGNVRQSVSFSLTMPGTESGYATQLEKTTGTSSAAPAEGLYALVRVNGHLGYTFFYDNDGALRYELATEGYGLDRFIEYEGDLIICASSSSLARLDGLGRVKQVYDLGEYDMHHDLQLSGDHTVVVLAEKERTTVEDIVLEVDLQSGQVSELLDFTDFMSDYVDEYTHVITPTDKFFWQTGQNDWLHLNTIFYMPEDDAIVVSSRETSTIMKVADIHSEPRIDYFAGDAEFWKGTAYEDLCLKQVGDFTPQYGQHSVEYDGPGEQDGTYYLLMFDNNYWSNSARSGYAPELDDGVNTELYGTSADKSHVYRYLIDENARTFTLVDSFDVPYSSIVSNVQRLGSATQDDTYVVNSGISKVFGEYDSEGNLIQQFPYECQMQTYRAFKLDFKGFWFADTGQGD